MIDKPLFIIICAYSVSFMVLAGQFVIADVFGLTLTNYKGDEIESQIVNSFNVETLNTMTESWINFTRFNSITDVATSFVLAAQVFVEFLTLLSGTYIFLIVYYWLGGGGAILGDNDDIIAGFIVGGLFIPYALMLGNTIIAKIRGV